jgi:hypothetical protein
MATTTTNFGWDIPQSTDLVKDGATAIAALGQDIDTAFVDFKGGTTGQVLKKSSATDLDVEWGAASSGLTLINTTSFSGVSSANFPVGTFSATYQNYRILVNAIINSGNATLSARLRVGGSDNTSSVYQIQRLLSEGSATPSSYNTGNINLWDDFGGVRTIPRPISADLFQPFEATPTSFAHLIITGSAANTMSTVGYHSGSTSFDSLSIIASSGTITGTMSAYGYAK